MEILIGILKIILAIVLATIVGKGVAKLKLPAILGWLITGMIIGPYAFGLLDNELLNAQWYKNISHFFECAVGLMFAKELIFKKLKAYGKQIVTITIFESVGTFVVVSAVFAVVCHILNMPLYLSIIFGGIALATAPAPALSIVSGFKTKGPITNSLIPIAMIDDVVAIIVFFTVNSYIASLGSTESGSIIGVILVSVALPIVLGATIGFVISLVLKRDLKKNQIMFATITSLVATFAISYFIDNFILPEPSLNYMFVGMAAFTTVANLISEHKMEQVVNSCTPIVGIGFIIMIMNLGAPLDYRLILSAGSLTAIYILSRAFGKYFSTYLGAKVSKADDNVKKYLGFVLLPHSGVSLVFTGMAVTTLNTFDSESAVIIQGTIAAAAVINEVFAVNKAKKGFDWGGEIGTKK